MLTDDLAGLPDPSSQDAYKQIEVVIFWFRFFLSLFFLTDSTLRDYCQANGAWEEGGRGWCIGRPKVNRKGLGTMGASRQIVASRRACWSPRRAFWEAGPLAWECGRRSPGSCPNRPRGSAYSSSWLGPCCNHPSQSTFAARHKRRGRNCVYYKLGLSKDSLLFLNLVVFPACFIGNSDILHFDL